ncbi:major facilitator superfamily domain-containing protein [Kockovaella imperatae]|uniref:Major facilitator superfamily domain-containing protein n=1 Tax=Kockovaella imperatae TaxID=4999 RepID=A0A1Y1US04_9TREE|nr:major facilitator superfamily domain-containing protein [Kockovaella imperatae]ORX40813.1 major facilitator superfamily domain-containing protein [Kockovaella imperatae]
MASSSGSRDVAARRRDIEGHGSKPLDWAPSPSRQVWMLSALMFSMMLCGWVEGSVGPLLPSLQAYYKQNYATMSYVFVTGFIGSLGSGFLSVYITDKLGFGRTILLGALAVALAYGLTSIRGTFFLFIFSYGVNGFGGAIIDAQANSFASRLPAVPSGVFQVQACFALGATIAPLVSTFIVERFQGRPHLFFLVAMGVSLVNALILVIAFKGKTEKQLLGAGADAAPIDDSHAVERDLAREDQPLLPRKRKQQETRGSGEKMLALLGNPTVWSVLGWVFFYCGAEMAISEYLTSYLITERNATISAGYASVGFWSAMTISRFLFAPLSRKLGWYNSVYIYSIISIGGQVIGYLTPSDVGTSIAFALIGLMYGPMWPNVLMVTAEELDEDLRVGIISFMGTTSGLGTAILPIAFGAIFDRWGIWIFPHLVGIMVVLSMLCWSLMKRKSHTHAE